MKKNNLLLVLLFLITIIASSQDNYLETEDSKIFHPKFDNGIPASIQNAMPNFEETSELHKTIKDLEEGTYIKTVSGLREATITIKQQNIGRIVLYAKLLNIKDSSVFNVSSTRVGNLQILPFRQNKLIENSIYKTVFDEDIYQQIHYFTEKEGIDEIKIKFRLENKDDFFILEKLKVIPLNTKGVSHYKELEERITAVQDLTNNLENNSTILKTSFKDQLNKIEAYHKNLKELLVGKLNAEMAIISVNSLNPFESGEFLNHYNRILEKANTAEKVKIENLANEIKENNFKNVVITLDNLLTGGTFGLLIDAIDGFLIHQSKYQTIKL